MELSTVQFISSKSRTFGIVDVFNGNLKVIIRQNRSLSFIMFQN